MTRRPAAPLSAQWKRALSSKSINDYEGSRPPQRSIRRGGGGASARLNAMRASGALNGNGGGSGGGILKGGILKGGILKRPRDEYGGEMEYSYS